MLASILHKTPNSLRIFYITFSAYIFSKMKSGSLMYSLSTGFEFLGLFFVSSFLCSSNQGSRCLIQIQDDDEVLEPKPLKIAMDKEVEDISPPQVTPVKEETTEAALSPLSPMAQPALSHESLSERIQLPVTIHSIIAETTNDVRNEKIT